jgi:hypothetical protein
MPSRRHPHLTDIPQGEAILEYLTCRVMRHAWDPIPADFTPSFGDAVMLRCMRCGTIRIDVFSRLTGDRLAPPRYDHPPGYRDADRHTMSWWRATWAEGLGEALHRGDPTVKEQRPKIVDLEAVQQRRIRHVTPMVPVKKQPAKAAAKKMAPRKRYTKGIQRDRG